MEHRDDISELSFFDDDLGGEFCAVAKLTKKRIPCRVLGCPKLFSHSSSMYRHVSHSHRSVLSANNEVQSVFRNTKSDFGLNRNYETATTPVSSSINLNTCVNLSSTGAGTRKTIQEEIQDLHQQMFTAGHGALFAHFQTVLETIPQTDEKTIDHLKSFHRVLYKVLLNSTTETGADRFNKSTELPRQPRQMTRPEQSVLTMYLGDCWASPMDISDREATSSTEDKMTQEHNYIGSSSDTSRTQPAFDGSNEGTSPMVSTSRFLIPTQENNTSMDDMNELFTFF